MDISVTGVADALNQINQKIKMLKKNNTAALREIGLDLLDKATKLAPIDTDGLKESGFSETEINAVIIGFTHPEALNQHEHTEFNHPLGGQAKYLEQPFNANSKKYIENLAKSTKKAVE